MVIFATIRRHLRNNHFAQVKGCRSPRSHAPLKDPIIGFDFIWESFLRKGPGTTLQASHDAFCKLGSTYTVTRWTSRAIHTCDSANIRHMLATGFEDFQLPNVRISVMSDLLGTGIFTLDGRSWSHARAVLRPTLAKQKMYGLPAILERHFEALMYNVDQESSAVDLQPILFGFAMDVATEFLMGQSTKMLEGHHPISREHQFVEDYMRCSEEASKKMRLGPLSHFRCNPEATTSKRRVFQYIDEYIRRSLCHQQEGVVSEPNFITELADTFEDPKALRDQVLHILLASRDTTASLLSNLFFMLSKRPAVYNKLRQEILSVVGDEIPTFEQLKDIQYLRWCVNECITSPIPPLAELRLTGLSALRLHPVIPSNARQAACDTTLPHGGGVDGKSPLFVKKGTVVLYSVYSMHRSSDVFGDYPEDFVPERWRGLRPGWSYLPFNGGPRVCIGRRIDPPHRKRKAS